MIDYFEEYKKCKNGSLESTLIIVNNLAKRHRSFEDIKAMFEFNEKKLYSPLDLEFDESYGLSNDDDVDDNLRIIQAYFAYAVDHNEEAALTYLSRFVFEEMCWIKNYIITNLYYDFEESMFEDINKPDAKAIMDNAKKLLELLAKHEDKYKFEYSVFLFGILGRDTKDIDKAFRLLKELNVSNKSGVKEFTLMLLNSYDLLNDKDNIIDYRKKYYFNTKSMIEEYNDSIPDEILPYIIFDESIEETVKINYLHRILSRCFDDNEYVLMQYFIKMFEEKKFFSLDFIDNLNEYLSNEEIAKILYTIKTDYDISDLMKKYKV